MTHPDIQKWQDMLSAIQSQREQALDAHVVYVAESAAHRRTLEAAIVALKKTVAERDVRIKNLEAELEKLKPGSVAA